MKITSFLLLSVAANAFVQRPSFGGHMHSRVQMNNRGIATTEMFMQEKSEMSVLDESSVSTQEAHTSKSSEDSSVSTHEARTSPAISADKPFFESPVASKETVADMDVEKEMSKTDSLMKQVKDAGTAGIVSYALWELAFWFVSVPVCVAGYREVTGHWPDLSSEEDLKQLGAEAFAFVNFARFAVPLRIGLALSTTPWIDENIVNRFLKKDDGNDVSAIEGNDQ